MLRRVERHRDRWRGVETLWHGEGAEWSILHSCVVDKNWEEYLEREGS